MPETLTKPSKRLEVRRRIEEMIRREGLWGQRLMGERQLAAEVGVCRRTVQGALAGLEADGLVERRHGSGTYVVEKPKGRGRSRAARIAIIAAGHSERGEGWDYLGEMIRGVLARAPRLRAEAAVLSLAEPPERERVWDAAEMRRFDGFISVARDERELLTYLLGLNRGPVVLLDHYVRDLPVVGVVNSSFMGMRALARHLVALGHRRVAFLDCHNRAETNPEKFAGYRVALGEAGVPLDERLVAAPPGPCAGAERDGHVRRATAALLELEDPPTAILGFDDDWALPAVGVLEGRGHRVGRDFSVAGYGDRAYRTGRSKTFTSCRIYPRQMGRAALRAALARAKAGEGRSIIVRDRPCIRESTCPPPGR